MLEVRGERTRLMGRTRSAEELRLVTADPPKQKTADTLYWECEFRTVVAMACDDEIIPSHERIETVGDDADLEEVYNTERHLLYVACTRGRDHLLVTGVEPASEFLDDLSKARAMKPAP